MSEDRSKIREEKGSLVIRAVMKEAVSFMIKISETREEDDSQKALEASRDRLLDFYVPLAYILHLLESCRFSKRLCFPGQF